MDAVVNTLVVTISQPGAYSSPRGRRKDVNVGRVCDGDYLRNGEESWWVEKASDLFASLFVIDVGM